MKTQIAKLVEILEASDNLKMASTALSQENPKLSPRTAFSVMQDVLDYKEQKIDEAQLSLYLVSHGY